MKNKYKTCDVLKKIIFIFNNILQNISSQKSFLWESENDHKKDYNPWILHHHWFTWLWSHPCWCYFWEEYGKGIGLNIFISDHSNIFNFLGATTFEEHVCNHSKHHGVHHHPLHILVVVQNLAYDNKLTIFFWLKKKTYWSLLVEGVYDYNTHKLEHQHCILRTSKWVVCGHCKWSLISMFHFCTSVGNSTNFHLIWFELRKLVPKLSMIIHMLQSFSIAQELYVTIHMPQNFSIVQKLFVIIHMVQSFDIVELFVTIHIQCTKVQHWHCKWLSYMN